MGERRKRLRLIQLCRKQGLLQDLSWLPSEISKRCKKLSSTLCIWVDLWLIKMAQLWRRTREVLDKNFWKSCVEDLPGWTFTSCKNSGLSMSGPNSQAFIFVLLSSKKYGQQATFGWNHGWAQPEALPQTSFFTPNKLIKDLNNLIHYPNAIQIPGGISNSFKCSPVIFFISSIHLLHCLPVLLLFLILHSWFFF